MGKSVLLGLTWMALAVILVGCRAFEEKSHPEIRQSSTSSVPSATITLTFLPTKFAAITPTSTLAPQNKTSTPTQTPSPEPTQTLAAGATKSSNMDGMLLIFIPAGEFLMGSDDVDMGADYDEFPQHAVNLDAYWIDQTVITNKMYAKFLNEVGNQVEGRSTWLDAGDEDTLLYQQNDIWLPKSGYEEYPVVEITWFGAQAYCQWVGRQLPTEAEWEKAARGSDGRVYPWGDDIDCEKAHYANCITTLQPVAGKPAGASPYGVLGMSGNVWEWVADWYIDDYYTTSPRDNPTGPEDGLTRSLRGGSWEYDWKHLRVANRRHNGPAASMHDYGFRCVMPENP